MKRISFILLICLLFLTGCFKRDNMEDITIYTSIYPIEFVTNTLYGQYSKINSIYPNGIITSQYELTDKQITDYSKNDLFIFNGLSNEGNYISSMRNNNKNLKIINATDNMEYNYGMEELWLDPSNLLTIARNIKVGFNEYIDNYYLKSVIEDNYQQLKIDLSNLEAKISLMIDKADNKVIVTGSDLFKFLENEKYNLTVYSLEENNNLNDKTIQTVKKLITSGKVKKIFIKQHEESNETVKNLVAGTNVEIITLNTITNLTETERNSKKDYLSIMNENIELLKSALYN